MKTTTESRSYPVSPVRRWVILGTFAPILLMAGFLLFGEEPQVGFILLLVISPIFALAQWVICYTRLILNPEGVIWRQLGCRIETGWGKIASVRLDRGREGFIGHEPFTGPGVKRMAALRGMGMKGVPLYDEQQQAALAEGRFIPLEAFAYAIRNGEIIADLERWAPSLAKTVQTSLTDKEPTEE